MYCSPPSGYDNINFNYTKTNIPVLDALPDGYRWADEVECEFWWHIEGAVQINRPGGSSESPWTSIAVPTTLIDLQAYHS